MLSRTSQAPIRTILCIDDDETILRYEKALLEASGYVVLTAASAQQGLRLATMRRCDVVVLDYQMPRMTGRDVAFEIRRVKPDLTIVFLSGTEVPLHALALVDAFVPKLDLSRLLLPTIAQLCSRLATTGAPRVPARRSTIGVSDAQGMGP